MANDNDKPMWMQGASDEEVRNNTWGILHDAQVDAQNKEKFGNTGVATPPESKVYRQASIEKERAQASREATRAQTAPAKEPIEQRWKSMTDEEKKWYYKYQKMTPEQRAQAAQDAQNNVGGKTMAEWLKERQTDLDNFAKHPEVTQEETVVPYAPGKAPKAEERTGGSGNLTMSANMKYALNAGPTVLKEELEAMGYKFDASMIRHGENGDYIPTSKLKAWMEKQEFTAEQIDKLNALVDDRAAFNAKVNEVNNRDNYVAAAPQAEVAQEEAAAAAPAEEQIEADVVTEEKTGKDQLRDDLTTMEAVDSATYNNFMSAFQTLANGNDDSSIPDEMMQLVINMMKQYGYDDNSMCDFAKDALSIGEDIAQGSKAQEDTQNLAATAATNTRAGQADEGITAEEEVPEVVVVGSKAKFDEKLRAASVTGVTAPTEDDLKNLGNTVAGNTRESGAIEEDPKVTSDKEKARELLAKDPKKFEKAKAAYKAAGDEYHLGIMEAVANETKEETKETAQRDKERAEAKAENDAKRAQKAVEKAATKAKEHNNKMWAKMKKAAQNAGHWVSDRATDVYNGAAPKRVKVDASNSAQTVYTLSGFEGRDATNAGKLANGIYTFKKDENGNDIVMYKANAKAQEVRLEANAGALHDAMTQAAKKYPANTQGSRGKEMEA